MKKLAEVYAQSWKEVRHVRSLTTAAMFMAVSVVLGYFTIEAGPYLKIGFGSVANEFVYYLFGPVLGVVYGCLLDLVKFVAKPTGAFFPGFTKVSHTSFSFRFSNNTSIFASVPILEPISLAGITFVSLITRQSPSCR